MVIILHKCILLTGQNSVPTSYKEDSILQSKFLYDLKLHIKHSVHYVYTYIVQTEGKLNTLKSNTSQFKIYMHME